MAGVWLQGGVVDTVLRVRCGHTEKDAWVAAAGGERGLSEWVRRTLNEQVQLEAVQAREDAPMTDVVGAMRSAQVAALREAVGRGVVVGDDLARGFRGPVPRKGSTRG